MLRSPIITPGLIGEAHECVRLNTCPVGHPLSGSNLYQKPDGQWACRACQRVAVRVYTKKKRGDSVGRVTDNAYHREQYYKNKEVILARLRRKYTSDPGYREVVKARTRERYERNREKLKAQARERYAERKRMNTSLSSQQASA